MNYLRNKMAYKIKTPKLKEKKSYSVSKDELEIAEFEAKLGGWVEKEKYRRLKIAYDIEHR